MPDLLDVNVWVALALDKHPHRSIVQNYWANQAAETLCFNTITRLGFLRVTSKLDRFEGGTGNVAFWESIYHQWLQDPAVEFLSEPAKTWEQFGDYVARGQVSHKTGTDAYLASFAVAADLRIVTLDQDFDHFSGLHVLNLLR